MNGLLPKIKPIPLDNQGSFSQIQLIIGYKDFLGLLVSGPHYETKWLIMLNLDY